MSSTGPQMGFQNGACIIRNDVLGSPLHKGVSQVASTPSPRSVLDRFGVNFESIFDRCYNIAGVTSRCVIQEHVANIYLQNHMAKAQHAPMHQTPPKHHSIQSQELRIHVSSDERNTCKKRGRRQWA